MKSLKNAVFALFCVSALVACQPTPSPTPTIPIEGSVTPVEGFSTPIPYPTATITPTPPLATPTPVPAPRFHKGVDVSNFWLPGSVSWDAAVGYMHGFQDAGYENLIAGSQFPDLANQQLWAAQTVGMIPAVYIELSTNSNIQAEIADAYQAINGVAITRTWIAFEAVPPSNMTPEDWVDNALNAAVAAGLPNVGIYTGAWWWNVWIHDSERFADWPLWYASYDGQASIDWNKDHFGAWDVPVLKQYMGSTTNLESKIIATYGYLPEGIIPRAAYTYRAANGPNVDLNVWLQ